MKGRAFRPSPGHISVCQLDIRVAFEALRHDLIGVTGTGCRQQEVESAAQAVRGAAVASGYLCGFCLITQLPEGSKERLPVTCPPRRSAEKSEMVRLSRLRAI